jgi:hypothetical protein
MVLSLQVCKLILVEMKVYIFNRSCFFVIFQKYRLCTKEYIASGKDGYDVFKDCPVVVCCLFMFTCNHFGCITTVNTILCLYFGYLFVKGY